MKVLIQLITPEDITGHSAKEATVNVHNKRDGGNYTQAGKNGDGSIFDSSTKGVKIEPSPFFPDVLALFLAFLASGGRECGPPDIKKAWQAGKINLGIRFDIVRTQDELKAALDIVREAGLNTGTNGLMIGMDISLPVNVLRLEQLIEAGITFISENPERFLTYNLAVDLQNPHVKISHYSKIAALSVPRRIWTSVAERKGVLIFQPRSLPVPPAGIPVRTDRDYAQREDGSAVRTETEGTDGGTGNVFKRTRLRISRNLACIVQLCRQAEACRDKNSLGEKEYRVIEDIIKRQTFVSADDKDEFLNDLSQIITRLFQAKPESARGLRNIILKVIIEGLMEALGFLPGEFEVVYVGHVGLREFDCIKININPQGNKQYFLTFAYQVSGGTLNILDQWIYLDQYKYRGLMTFILFTSVILHRCSRFSLDSPTFAGEDYMESLKKHGLIDDLVIIRGTDDSTPIGSASIDPSGDFMVWREYLRVKLGVPYNSLIHLSDGGRNNGDGSIFEPGIKRGKIEPSPFFTGVLLRGVYDSLNHSMVEMTFFSGGEKFQNIPIERTVDRPLTDFSITGEAFTISYRLTPFGNSKDGGEQQYTHKKIIPVILLMGMPGSGKGTVGPEMAKKLGIPHVSSGELLRKMWDLDPSIPPTPTLGAEKIIEHINKDRRSYYNGFVLDSNPISEETQSILERELEKEGFSILQVVSIETDKEIARSRFIKRPVRGGDDRYASLSDRFDHRMVQYGNVNELLIARYEEAGKIIHFDNNGNLDEMYRGLDEIIHELNIARVMEAVKGGGWSESDVRNIYMPLVEELINRQKKSVGGKLVIGITGLGGTGKTSMTDLFNVIACVLKGPGYSGILHQDSFLMTLNKIRASRVLEWTPESVNIKEISAAIDSFRNGKAVMQPVLSKIDKNSFRQEFKRIGYDSVKADGLLFVEGIDVINNNSVYHEELYGKFDVSLFVTAEQEDVKNWWIDREAKKYPDRSQGEHENKWRERVDKPKRSPASMLQSERSGVWINADIIIDKNGDHSVRGIYYRSPYARGRSITKIADVTVNPLRSPSNVIARLEERLDTLSGSISYDDLIRFSNVIDKLQEVQHNRGIGWIDVLARNRKDYVIGFADIQRNQIGLVADFFKTGGMFQDDDLRKAVFYFGYQLAFENRYHSVDRDYMRLHRILFGSEEIVSSVKVEDFVEFSAKPKEVPFSPMSAEQMRKLDSYERRNSLSVAKGIAERLKRNNGGRMPNVAFLTPTGKGGGVSVLLKDIAEVMCSGEIGIYGKWISTVRHENIDYWGASGKFQQSLMGSVIDVSEDDLAHLSEAMADNVAGMDLSGYDYIFMHEPYTLGMIPLIRRKYPEIKIIWFNHGDLSPAGATGRRLMRQYLSDADASIFSWMQEYIPQGDVGSPVVFMIHGINQENAKNVPVGRSFEKAVAEKYGIDITRPVILHVGRYNLSKDPLRSIAAYLSIKSAMAKKSQPAPQLVLTGIPISPSDWNLFHNLQMFARFINDPDIHIIAADNAVTEFNDAESESLRALGWDPEKLDSWDKSDLELNALQRLASVGIHPARNEGFGLVISEALVKGTSVVASNLGGIPTQITDKRFLVDIPKSADYDSIRISQGNFSVLLDMLKSDATAEVFAIKVLSVLNMDRQEKKRLEDETAGFISSEYSILRSLIGHLELIEVLTLIEQVKRSPADKEAKDSLTKVDPEYVSVIARQLRSSSREARDALLDVLKRLDDPVLESLSADLGIIENDKNDNFDNMHAKLKDMIPNFPKDYFPVLSGRLGSAQEQAVRNYTTALSLMGEDIVPDLIAVFDSYRANKSAKKIIIKALKKIGVMGNSDIRSFFEAYVSDCGVSLNGISRAGLSYDEVLGDIAESLANVSGLVEGESIAGKLINSGFYPVESLVEAVSGKRFSVNDAVERVNDIRERGGFKKDDSVDVALGYSLLLSDFEKMQVKADLEYNDYVYWLGNPDGIPVLGGVRSVEDKHIDELYYLSVEAYRLEARILETAERAKKLGRPFVVIANNTYGGQVAIAPVAGALKDKGIRVIYTRVPSGNVHLNRYYVPHGIFNEKDLVFMLNEKPVVFIVDGTNSMRGTVVDGLIRRFRKPHIPDSYLGYRNYFLALNEALGIKSEPKDFYISESMFAVLRQTAQYRRLVASMKKLLVPGHGPDSSSYRFSFWNAADMVMPIRVERVADITPVSRNVENISGPEIVFAQSVNELKGYAKGRSEHVPCYFDISLFESGYRNFDFALKLGKYGPQALPMRQKNLEIAGMFMDKLRFEEMIGRNDMEFEAVILDLDRTIMDFNETIKESVAKDVAALIENGRKVAVITEDRRENVLQRLQPLIQSLHGRALDNLYIYADSGTRGFTVGADGVINEFEDYNSGNIMDDVLIDRIRTLAENSFSGRLVVNDNAAVAQSLRIDLKVLEGNDIHVLIEQLRKSLENERIYAKVFKSGHTTIRIVRGNKKTAAEHFINQGGINDNKLVIIGDSALRNAADKDILTDFPKSVSINVGKYSQALENDNLTAVQGREKPIGINGAHKIVSMLVSEAILSDMEIIRRFNVEEIASADHYSRNVHEQYKAQEKAIVFQERRLKNIYDVSVEGLLGAQGKDQATGTVLLQRALNAVDDLKIVLEAKEKFIRLGVPAYHSHTNLKDDGYVTPDELVRHAVNQGVTVLYVTGHDRIDGSNAAIAYARSQDSILDMRPAVEIDAPFIGAGAITHMVIMAPDDQSVAKKLGEIGEDVFRRMQTNLRWRFKRISDLGTDAFFQESWNKVLKSNYEELKNIAADLVKEKLLDENVLESQDMELLRISMSRWFKDVRDYIQEHPQMYKGEFYNKLNVLGNWTDGINKATWKKGRSASYIRRSLRSFFNLLYTDQDVENEVVKEAGNVDTDKIIMRRADNLAEEAIGIGCRVVLAHVGFELFVAHEISDTDAFLERTVSMINKGYLHAIGAAWGREDRRLIDQIIIKPLRQRTGKSDKDLPIVSNIPDYHGDGYPVDKTSSITKGILHTDKNMDGTVEKYWTWEDSASPPDFDNYFVDGKFLAAPFIKLAERCQKKGEYSYAFDRLKVAYRTHPYSSELLNMLTDLVKVTADALEKQDMNGISARDGGRSCGDLLRGRLSGNDPDYDCFGGIAVYPGYFEDDSRAALYRSVIQQGLKVFERAVILVMARPEETPEYFERKVEKMRVLARDICGTAVIGIFKREELTEFFEKTRIRHLIRRIHSVSHDSFNIEAEETIAGENYRKYGLDIVFMMPEASYIDIDEQLRAPYVQAFSGMLGEAGIRVPGESILNSAEIIPFINEYLKLRGEFSPGKTGGKSAFYAGTFDPFTNGHLEVVRRAAEMFDFVYIGIGPNPDKAGKQWFSREENKAMIVSCLKAAGITNVEVLYYDGLTVDCARRLGAGVLLRGVRDYKDLKSELPLAWANLLLAPSIPTVFLVPYIYINVSSSYIKELLRKDALRAVMENLPEVSIDIPLWEVRIAGELPAFLRGEALRKPGDIVSWIACLRSLPAGSSELDMFRSALGAYKSFSGADGGQGDELSPFVKELALVLSSPDGQQGQNKAGSLLEVILEKEDLLSGVRVDIQKMAILIRILFNNPLMGSETCMKECDFDVRDIKNAYRIIQESGSLQKLLIKKSPYSNYIRVFRDVLSEDGFWQQVHAGNNPYPSIVTLHMGVSCNQHCRHCISYGVEYPKEESSCLLAKNDWISLVNELAENGTRVIHLSGGKEPLMNKDSCEVMKSVIDRGMDLILYTNGILMKKKIAEILVDASVVRVSVDTVNPSKCKALLGIPGRVLEIKKGNIRKLVELKKKRGGSVCIGISALVLRDTYLELEDVVKFGIETGVDFVEIKGEYTGRDNLSSNEMSDIQAILELIKKRYCNNGYGATELIVRDEMFAESALLNSKVCWRTRKKVVIDPFGRLCDCVITAHPGMETGHIIGRLQGSSFREVWDEGEAHRSSISTMDCEFCAFIERLTNLVVERIESDKTLGISPEDQPFMDGGSMYSVPLSIPQKVTKIGFVYLVEGSYGDAIIEPLGLETIKGYLQQEFRDKVEVVILHSRIHSFGDIIRWINTERPDIVGLSVFFGQSALTNKIINAVSGIYKDYKPLIVLGNNISTYNTVLLLNKYPNVVVVKGEGEQAMSGLVKFMRGECSLQDVPNAAFRKETGEIVETEIVPMDLACLGTPSRDLLPRVLNSGGVAFLETSRGCSGHCTFCSRRSFHRCGWRGRPVERILEDMIDLNSKGVKLINIVDDSFLGG
ncbi:MAG: pantetheine-phosphate adenylyltransferase, partial [Candidatus Omnitrophota bacterium]